MKNDSRTKAISRRFLLLGSIVVILAVLLLLTSKNEENRIFNVETVRDTVFVSGDSVVEYRKSRIAANPWRGKSRPGKNFDSARAIHPLVPDTINCQIFSSMVSTLFSPYYYSMLATPLNEVDLFYETCRNDSSYSFGVVCRWFSECPKDGVEWCSGKELEQYVSRSNYPIFLVLGIGGTPNMPNQMYVLRAWTLRNIISPHLLAKAHQKKPGKKFYFKPEGPWLN